MAKILLWLKNSANVIYQLWVRFMLESYGFAKLIRLFAALIVTLFLGAVSVLAVVWTVTTVGQLIPEEISNKIFSVRTTEEESVSAARTSHASVSKWVLHCLSANSANDLPSNLRPTFSDYRASIVQMVLGGGGASYETTKLKRLPTIQEMNAVQLSDALRTQRTELGRKASESYAYLQYVQWLAILIGLVTTVVVSVSSTELLAKSDTRLGTGLRFLAIFLPALGTAVAAINAFYNPRDDWNRSSNTLANLAQLHGQISVGIWSLECHDKDKNDESQKSIKAKLEEWTKRYSDIITIADSSPSSNKQEGQTKAPAAPGAPGSSNSQQGAATPPQ